MLRILIDNCNRNRKETLQYFDDVQWVDVPIVHKSYIRELEAIVSMERIESGKRNEVLSVKFCDKDNGGLKSGTIVIRHFRTKGASDERQFDRWCKGQIVVNKKNEPFTKLRIGNCQTISISGLYNIVRYNFEKVSNDTILDEDLLSPGEEFKVIEEEKCDQNLEVNESPLEILEFGEFILNELEGSHCRNVASWYSSFKSRNK